MVLTRRYGRRYIRDMRENETTEARKARIAAIRAEEAAYASAYEQHLHDEAVAMLARVHADIAARKAAKRTAK